MTHSGEFRIGPDDEFPHPVEPVPNFSESVYVNAFDHRAGVGGWARIGNRVSEGHAEMSVCLYLPDGRLACRFSRPALSGHQAFAAGGLSYEVLEPLRRVAMSYRGDVAILDDPSALHQPTRALSEAPRATAEIDWILTATSAVHGGEPTGPLVRTMYGRDFARGHFNQHAAVSGRMQVGGDAWPIDGFGWRDHSWGPRSWQAVPWYRLLIGNVGPADGFMILQISRSDGDGGGRAEPCVAGVLLVDGEYVDVDDMRLDTTWVADEPARVQAEIRTRRGVDRITGEILTIAPLRHRQAIDGQQLQTRIAEGFTRWEWAGRTGYGMSEYLDRIKGGRPVGVMVEAR